MNNNAKKLIEEFIINRTSLQKEEDVRSSFATVLKELSTAMGFNLQLTGHEVISAHGGSADSVYDNVIFEYKAPKKFNLQNGINEALYGRINSVTDRGLFHYLVNFALDEASGYDDEFLALLKSKIGVGFDGYKFIFCRFIESDSEINLYFKDKTREFGSISTSFKVAFDVEIVDEGSK